MKTQENQSLLTLARKREEKQKRVQEKQWKKTRFKTEATGTSLVAQWVRLRAPSAGGPGLIPGQGTKSHMHATTKTQCN